MITKTKPSVKTKKKKAPPLRWSVYLLRCADQTLYCGTTNDLSKRVDKHNIGSGAKYTRARRPVTLLWSKKCASRSFACQWECRIKKLKRAEKEDLILGGTEARRLLKVLLK